MIQKEMFPEKVYMWYTVLFNEITFYKIRHMLYSRAHMTKRI